MTATRRVLFALLVALVPTLAQADCAELRFDDTPFTVCTVDPAAQELRLFRLNADGSVLGSFGAVDQMLSEQGAQLGFAMNAGMYHPNRTPVGLYIEDGVQQMRTITSDGPGNFGLLPNGVFCILDGAARVIEARRFVADPPACRYATQSGPMLVIDGDLHPRFLPKSTSRYIRNGVGVDAAGRVYFAISDRPVNFHLFARLFRDQLNTPNALFLDGKVSRLYAPELGRSDIGLSLGPIVGAVVPLSR